ncbi:hypothetical protein KC19_3G082400 [Ceratodon purpureus]|uniref:PGG domain-containing protein n=1 Tax=Ceratodon purpureus TaxID=3225 RepID=A0A8T0IIB4_CERPU|nr:hypothetical protein KC19_3G082400 [Ceratodon purpureus]
MGRGDVPPTGVFETASSSADWYRHLERDGSCKKLYSLLVEKYELIHKLGPKGRTVLHKGVEHGYVKLVKFILVNMFDEEGTCTCKEHGPDVPRLTREQLLRQTCEDGITAVHIAVVSGSPKMVLLLEWAIDKTKLELKQKTVLRKGEIPSRRKNDNGIRTRSAREIKECEGGAGNGKLGEDVVSKEQTSSSFTSISLKEVERGSKCVNNLARDLPVPDVKDDSIDGMYEEGSEKKNRIQKVYNFMEQFLGNPQSFGIDPTIQKPIDTLKDECEKNVEFEFVPVAHVFVHIVVRSQYSEFSSEIFRAVVCACNECDVREGREKGSMVVTLFRILDPRGRTIFHTALDNVNGTCWMSTLLTWMLQDLEMSSEVVWQCVNAYDGAGRTILYYSCIQDIYVPSSIERVSRLVDWEAKLFRPLQLYKLEKWLYPDSELEWIPDFFRVPEIWHIHPIYLALLFNKVKLFKSIFKNSKYPTPMPFDQYSLGLLQIAAFLGRTSILEIILKEKTKINDVVDQGLGNARNDEMERLKMLDMMPAIHCAALSSQVEGLQSILNSPMYDPIIQHETLRHYIDTEEYGEGSALHLLLQKTNFNNIVKKLQTFSLLHVLPNSSTYAPLKKEFSKLHFDEHEPKDFSANEISCINLLLQAGIDIWTPHYRTKERPNPGPMANDQARRWWYDKVVSEVVTQKTSINNASNATSVIATLVATASFIGPLQPPLGWAGDGYVHTSLISVRVYLVCNILSFYFSIASILMAVLPAIPMPKESLYDELFRSQRCLKTAALLLLVSIICILISFTSASIAVVSSERHDKQLVGASTALGWVVCSAVLVIYIIRLLRMLFHRNNRFRRWFAKNMIF